MRGAMPHCFSTAATLVLVDEELTAELRVHEVFNGQDLVQGSLIEQALLQDEFLDALASLQGLLGNQVTVVVLSLIHI